ncbi:M14 family metallopeptidase [Streptomyces europaeiscabiei]|uniref:M14 family zinc carboxypeptidase n=1 Tax=Streptomyces europaeiscabiei TaxID=146819 RepID=A0ABU4NJP3_9ACTN|nr:M14 family metallopeptidase [Streptomyces europaeiscabiei]MDX2757838.1 M14 family zinc carboxypeptidase [Streptomyces europaeiscabiei]MDX3543712.1 M14 family zinc carboxypeptidase [Streptomyces europaeiscabiei]MDX3553451.1 M14 family zinc carboxypeptidase [Streptomyces europaeiscabiei]MDX3701645.1 M14 family zinc carboxypeptidase [Streptomyces europaeiscabiei]MDX3709493.1 M14 family zinc carboxypeptidase [Streptomyces europaeiscabiei]
MRRRARSILAAGALLLGGGAGLAPLAQAAENDGSEAEEVKVFRAEVTKKQIPLLLAAGQDGHELSEQAPEKGTASVEVYLTDKQADALEGQGVKLKEHRLTSKAEARVAAAGDGVYRPYSGAGNIKEEILRTGQENPSLTKVVSLGKSLQGQDILAVKLTKDAKKTKDGAKPSVLYMSNQHAREWITPEMTRRLMHHYLDNYKTDKRIKKIVDTTELWFVISANPDGYDFTHRDAANRQWRKNVRDINGDNAITVGDGVDLNRNFAYKWGYDNEGSSPFPTSETYRGGGPGSEPETKALDAFEKRIGFEYGINYHSAAELILYGVGWQVASPTPDDVLYEALAGTPENPAVPGYHPQLSSELYTTNGEADGHAANVNGTAMFTPEMSTCQTASSIAPDDAWKPEDCASVFTFPDDEKLIQQEFAKNIPFALSVAESAATPDRPKSSVGIDAPDFTPASFTTSYSRGKKQEISVVARKSVDDKELKYRINGRGRTYEERLKSWKGGETFGGEDNLWFDEYRAKVREGEPGDKVEVWFTGETKSGKPTKSERFTYTVAERPKADTLVVAEEGATATQTQTYVDALKANGKKALVWDVATQGAPDALGVLEHFKQVVHYTGAVRPGVATQLELRAYLNEGGKLIEAGESAGGSVDLGGGTLSNDFSQYYLGAYSRTSLPDAKAFAGLSKLAGFTGTLGDAPGNPLNTAGSFGVTSDALPVETFPQFKSAGAGQYPGTVNPYGPYEGASMAAATHTDYAWNRLTRTIDLTSVSAADDPTLRTQLLWSTEEGYDHALLEAHTVGADDWTTLPETGGATSATVPTECEAGYFIQGHPALKRYLTLGAGGCTPTGTSGSWNSFTGASDGWQKVEFDLSAYAGKKVEVSLSYVTDPGSGGRGVLADNATVVIGGTPGAVEGFETSLGAWSVPGPPAGSPAVVKDWGLSGELFKTYGAVTTDDTVLLGFGLEQVPAAADRKALLGKALAALKN